MEAARFSDGSIIEYDRCEACGNADGVKIPIMWGTYPNGNRNKHAFCLECARDLHSQISWAVGKLMMHYEIGIPVRGE